jgi:hypothetical protein
MSPEEEESSVVLEAFLKMHALSGLGLIADVDILAPDTTTPMGQQDNIIA